jgi:glycosyltransferase involved in cell wall biosynthesis
MNWKSIVGYENKLRVAYIDHSGEMGGAEHLLLALIDGLPRERVEPLLICGQEGRFAEQARKLNIPTQVVPSPRFVSLSFVVGTRKILNPLAILRNLFSIIKSAQQLSRYLRTAHVELVQTNSNFAHIYGGLAARFAGLPCIWYFHDLIEPQRLRGGIALVWRFLANALAMYVVGVSQAVVDALGVGSRASVIYTGLRAPAPVSLPSLHDTLKLDSNDHLVAYIGRIGYVKALDVLVRAAQHVIQNDSSVHFVILGEAMFGEQQVKNDLVTMVERSDLTNNWHWMGYDPHATARLAEVDLLVLNSRREALPLVLIEAGLMGKPAVGTRVGGIPEIIVDNETGILVSAGNDRALADAILRLVHDPVLAQAMGNKAKQRVEKVFAPERYYSEFLSLYARFAKRMG